MPTLFIKEGFRFFFYSADGVEPMHIHVEYGGGMAKFWLFPTRLSYSYHLKAPDLKKARILIEDNINLIKEKWNAYFRSPKT